MTISLLLGVPGNERSYTRIAEADIPGTLAIKDTNRYTKTKYRGDTAGATESEVRSAERTVLKVADNTNDSYLSCVSGVGRGEVFSSHYLHLSL